MQTVKIVEIERDETRTITLGDDKTVKIEVRVAPDPL